MTLADKMFTDMELRQHIFDPDEGERDDETDTDDKGSVKEED